MEMQNITVTRYDDGPVGVKNVMGWLGYIQPDDRSWIIFVHSDGTNHMWTKRESTGAVIGDAIVW